MRICHKFSQYAHVTFLLICFIYFGLAFYSSNLDYTEIFSYIWFYFLILAPYTIAFIFIFWAGKSIVFILENRREGFSGLERCWKELRNDYISKEAVFRFAATFPLIPFFNFSYSSLKQKIPIVAGSTLDSQLHNIDYFIHGKNIPWNLLQPVFGHSFSTSIMDALYLCWGSLFIYTMLWMAISKSEKLRQQFFFSLIFCWVIIGNLGARLLASAGPCYYSKVVTNAPDPYISMMTYLRSIPNLKAVQIQDALWRSHINGTFMPLGGISAMPSMHVSVAALLALLYLKFNRRLGIFFVLFAITIQIGSVHLGWHYAIDGYLSALLTVIIWQSTGLALKAANKASLPLQISPNPQ